MQINMTYHDLIQVCSINLTRCSNIKTCTCIIHNSLSNQLKIFILFHLNTEMVFSPIFFHTFFMVGKILIILKMHIHFTSICTMYLILLGRFIDMRNSQRLILRYDLFCYELLFIKEIVYIFQHLDLGISLYSYIGTFLYFYIEFSF